MVNFSEGNSAFKRGLQSTVRTICVLDCRPVRLCDKGIAKLRQRQERRSLSSRRPFADQKIALKNEEDEEKDDERNLRYRLGLN